MTNDPSDIQARLDAIEARLDALTSHQATREPPITPDDEQYWAIAKLAVTYPAGGLVFAGTATLPTGEQWVWQEEESLPQFFEADWTVAAPTLAALGHPLRLTILHAIMHGQQTTAELQARPELGGAGKLYHHLRDLQSAGWLTVEGRGRYVVPAQKIVPLLAILRASGTINVKGG